MPAAASGSVVWPRRRDEMTFDRLQKFWHDLTPQERQDLLKLDKQTLIEHARKNSYCSRCNGLLLDCFAQIAMYGKSLRQHASDVDLSRANSESRVRKVEQQDGEQDPSVRPWGGLSTTKDDILTLLDCFIKSNSLKVLQNVFDSALARERERKMRYPDACSAGGRGYGTREMCALHTARPLCDTLVDFWSPLGEETRSSLLRMRVEDFIEKLTRRFNRKKFCRDCRKNVIREFKGLKEPKRKQRERRCNCWFCVDNGFHCEVFEDGIVVDWSQCLSETDGSFHHFEWAVGTREGESDIIGFEDVGMNARVQKTGIDLVQFETYFVTLRAWQSDDHCTEYCVKAQVLKGQSCVQLQHTLVVSDGFVTITNGESMKSFFERAQKVEEEDEDVAMNNDDGNLDADGSHTQKHAKTPELAREFLLDAASVIFKDQIVKAFRVSTAQQNATTVFVSLALKLLEERVHVACKELITLENQNMLLEEEEKEMREEQERRIKRKMKERQKKQRQKQKMKEKGAKLVESKSLVDMTSPARINSSTPTNHESTDSSCSRDSANAEVVDVCSAGITIDQSSCRENNADHCNGVTGSLSPTSSSDCCCTLEHSDSQDEPVSIGNSQWQSIERKRHSPRSCSFVVARGGHTGSAQKNTITKQVWQPLDARKKTGLHSTDNALGSVGNVNTLTSLGWDGSGYQKLRRGCHGALHLASENSSNIYKSGERGQAASSYGTHHGCYPTHDEGYWHDEDQMTRCDSSCSLSSCMGEGDKESSSSNETISSEQNTESPLSDEREECSDRVDSSLDVTVFRTATRSLFEACASKGFREYRPEAIQPSHHDRFGFNVPFQDQRLHHQRMHLPPNSSAAIMRFHNHRWASPTNRNFQNVDCRVGYSNVNPWLAHQQCQIHPEPIQTTAASFIAMPPPPPCQNGSNKISGYPHGNRNYLERHPSNKLKPLGKKDLPGESDKTQDAVDVPFSLFQFSLPIASPATPSSEGNESAKFEDRMPLVQFQAQLISKEQADVKEYKLFSTKDCGIFSIMQIT